MAEDLAASREPDIDLRFIAEVEQEGLHMLVERNLKVMNVAVVGDAYAIAANYLRKSGLISDTSRTNDRLLEIIIMMIHCGETHKIRVANKAISKFEDTRAVRV